MRKAILALCAFGLFGQSAFALTQLALVSGGSTLVIDDNVAPDASATTGTILYSNANFNSWNITVVAGVTFAPNVIPIGMDLAVLATCTAGNACATNDLYVGLGSFSNYTQQVGSFKTAFSTSQTGGTSLQKAYYTTAGSAALPPPIPTGEFATIGPFVGAGAFAGTAQGGGPSSGTYTLILWQQYHGAGTFSADGNITGVPEPGGILLLGSGLLVAGAALRRKLQSLA